VAIKPSVAPGRDDSGVRTGVTPLAAQPGELIEATPPFWPKNPGEETSKPPRQGRTSPAGRYRDQEVAAAKRRRRVEIALRRSIFHIHQSTGFPRRRDQRAGNSILDLAGNQQQAGPRHLLRSGPSALKAQARPLGKLIAGVGRVNRDTLCAGLIQ